MPRYEIVFVVDATAPKAAAPGSAAPIAPHPQLNDALAMLIRGHLERVTLRALAGLEGAAAGQRDRLAANAPGPGNRHGLEAGTRDASLIDGPSGCAPTSCIPYLWR